MIPPAANSTPSVIFRLCKLVATCTATALLFLCLLPIMLVVFVSIAPPRCASVEPGRKSSLATVTIFLRGARTILKTLAFLILAPVLLCLAPIVLLAVALGGRPEPPSREDRAAPIELVKPPTPLVAADSQGLTPPKVAMLILSLIPKKDREDVQGDIMERYTTMHDTYGARYAVFWCWWQVASSIVPLLVAGLMRIAKVMALLRLIQRIFF